MNNEIINFRGSQIQCENKCTAKVSTFTVIASEIFDYTYARNLIKRALVFFFSGLLSLFTNKYNFFKGNDDGLVDFELFLSIKSWCDFLWHADLERH